MDILKEKTMSYKAFEKYITDLTSYKGFKGAMTGNSDLDQYGHKLTWIEAGKDGKIIKVTLLNEKTNQECSIDCSKGWLEVSGHDGGYQYSFGYDENKVLRFQSSDDGHKAYSVQYRENGSEISSNTKLRDDKGNLVSEEETYFSKNRSDWRRLLVGYANKKVTSISDTIHDDSGKMEAATLFVSAKGQSLLRIDSSENGQLQKTTMQAVPTDVRQLKEQEWNIRNIKGGTVLWSATRDANDTFIFYDANNVPTDVVAKDMDGKKRRHSLKQMFANARPKTGRVSRGENEG